MKDVPNGRYGCNITDRKQAEEVLHRLNRQLRAISNYNRVMIQAKDERTLLNDICRIICNEASYRLAWVGYAEDDAAKTVRPVAWSGCDSGYIANTRLHTLHRRPSLFSQPPGGKKKQTNQSNCNLDAITTSGYLFLTFNLIIFSSFPFCICLETSTSLLFPTTNNIFRG